MRTRSEIVFYFVRLGKKHSIKQMNEYPLRRKSMSKAINIKENNKINLSAEQPVCFVPTPNELAVLVGHWANEAIKEEANNA